MSINTTAITDTSKHYQDKICLAEVMYREARGEPYRGKLAVAQVVLNRLHYREYPDTVCEVIFQKNQFQWVKKFKGFEAPKEFFTVASTVLSGKHEMRWLKATHFHATYVHPKWYKLTKITKIGNHIFYKI